MIHFRLLADGYPMCWIENRTEYAEVTTSTKDVTCPECLSILNAEVNL